MKVLLVDDEPLVLAALERVLFFGCPDDWEVVTASGGAAALHALSRETFDVVVTDMLMPDVDGCALLREVADRCPQMARIVLSGHAPLDAKTDAYRLAHRFLHKPCPSSVLREAVRSAVATLDRVDSPELRRAIASISTLPSAPRIGSALSGLVDDPRGELGSGAALVERDPGLSAKVLQIAVAYAIDRQTAVTNVRHAIAMLAARSPDDLAFCIGARRSLAKTSRLEHMDLDALQLRAERIARLARKLASPGQRDVAFSAGIVADVGILVLAARLPGTLAELATEADRAERTLGDLAEATLGLSHAQFGAVLLRLWGLPTPIVSAIATQDDAVLELPAEIDAKLALRIATRVVDSRPLPREVAELVARAAASPGDAP